MRCRPKPLSLVLSLAASASIAACSGGVNAVRTAAPAATALRASQSGAVNWPVWGFDPARSSFNSAEYALTTSNVQQLQEKWQISLGNAPADAAPILLLGAGPSHQTLLFVTTKKGTTLGIDAVSGQIVWRFTTTGSGGTTSAPAADPSDGAIYAAGIDGEVHKLNASDGTEIQSGGFPVLVSLMPKSERVESPLNVANGYLYVTLGGAGDDHPPYDGHIVSVNLATGTATIFNSLCSEYRELLGPTGCPQQRSGIWARGGAVADPDSTMGGRIYAATGNGDFDANVGGYDYGDTVISLAPDLSSVLGTYTPSDYVQLDDTNGDVGSTSPAILPVQPSSQTPLMLVQGGKDGVVRLVNRAPLPGVGGELQTLKLPRSMYSAPAVWTDPSNRTWVFFGLSRRVYAYRLRTVSGVSRLHFAWAESPGSTTRGTSPAVASGIVFVAFQRRASRTERDDGGAALEQRQSERWKNDRTGAFREPDRGQRLGVLLRFEQQSHRICAARLCQAPALEE